MSATSIVRKRRSARLNDSDDVDDANAVVEARKVSALEKISEDLSKLTNGMGHLEATIKAARPVRSSRPAAAAAAPVDPDAVAPHATLDDLYDELMDMTTAMETIVERLQMDTNFSLKVTIVTKTSPDRDAEVKDTFRIHHASLEWTIEKLCHRVLLKVGEQYRVTAIRYMPDSINGIACLIPDEPTHTLRSTGMIIGDAIGVVVALK